MQTVIVDFEFTGLDNSFIKDNEIIQCKMLNVETGSAIIKNFASLKANGAGSFLVNKIDNSNEIVLFSEASFINLLLNIGVYDLGTTDDVVFYGFSPSTDIKMLKKYNIHISISCIRELLQLTEYEYKLATQGNNLETTYYIVTGKNPKIIDHGDLKELNLIYELYKSAQALKKNDYLTVVPFGHCAGMPIIDYIINYRRQADGYRFNNTDIFQQTLDYHIEELSDFMNENF